MSSYYYVYYNINTSNVVKTYMFKQPYLMDGKPPPIPPGFQLLDGIEIKLPIDPNTQKYTRLINVDLDNNEYQYIYSGLDLTSEEILNEKLSIGIPYSDFYEVYYNITTGVLSQDIETIINNYSPEDKEAISGIMYSNIEYTVLRRDYYTTGVLGYLGYDSDFIDDMFIRYYDSGVL